MTQNTTPESHRMNIPFGSSATDAHTRKRRRAEWRLMAYGIGAISLAGMALAALLWSVVGQAGGALRESYITLPVHIAAQDIDPKGTRDPKLILRANFSGLTKDLLKQTFPTVTARKSKRQLYDIVSNGAAFELAQMVADDVSLVGQEFEYDFLASDVSDLYLKGEFGTLTSTKTSGTLSVSIIGDSAEINSTADDFVDLQMQLKHALLGDAKQIMANAQLQENGVIEFQRRADTAIDADIRDAALAEVTVRRGARDTLLDKVRNIEARAADMDANEPLSKQNISALIKVAGGWIKLSEIGAHSAKGTVILPLDTANEAHSEWSLMITQLPETSRKISDLQVVLLEALKDQGAIRTVFNTRFFTASDSREPELAGIWGATVGTFWTMLVTFGLAFPIGIFSAIYLEEFAPKNRFTRFIEININNLAAVPSIVFGLLGLSVFLGMFGVPRSAPLAGGIVLALMTLPTIIIAARAAISAVPPSIRDAALGIGASKLQTTFHHILPLAMPGVLTGTILGMAQALGETAPLIMIGMVAFIVDVPGGIMDSATVLPVQVYRWSDFPERAFEARTAAAICVLLAFLVVMNLLAVLLRRRFERRW